jgi:hypothetical protein
VSADEEMLTWYGRSPMRVVAHPPHDLPQAKIALSLVARMRRLGLRPGEVAFFFSKLAEFLAASPGARLERFDKLTWWQYLDADRKSPAFQDLISATTRTMVAAKAREVSAYTIANIAVRTLLDGFGQVDRMLNGPTNEVWIDPWIEHLRGRGVHFHPGQEIDSIEFDTEKKTVRALSFTSLLTQSQQRVLWTLSLVESWCRVIDSLMIGPRHWGKTLSHMPAGTPLADKQRVFNEFVDSVAVAVAGIAQIAVDLRAESDTAARIIAELRHWPPTLPPQKPHSDGPYPDPAANAALQAVATVLARATVDLDDLAVLLRREHKALQAIVQEIAQAAQAPEEPGPDREPFKPGVALAKSVGDLTDAIRDSLGSLLPGTESGAKLTELLTSADPDGDRWKDPRDTRVTYFVFALPIEQMAYQVNRSPMLTHYDPSLRNLILLAEYTDWMVGIQFYLTEEVELVRGHLVCMDSEWGLTAVEHTQYWRDATLPPDIKAIISVDIASWDRKGRFNQKEAFNCTPQEIAEETWRQLTESVNRDSKAKVLRDEMFRGGKLAYTDGQGKHWLNYHLDDSLVDLLDRRKQGSYEKARSVRFSADELLRRQTASGHESETPYAWGRRLNFNVEPLLINRVGTRALRPDVRTAIPNMFLAADYVSTGTDLACMESANEAGRLAVNALLDAAGSTERPCEIWKFSAPQRVMEGLLSAGRIGNLIDGFARGPLEAAAGHIGRFAGDLLNRGRQDDV